jgi:hypothetical protein
MPAKKIDYDSVSDLQKQAQVIARLAEDDKAFREVYEAFRVGDRDRFQSALRRAGLIRWCHIVCEWIRIKECIFVCQHLCPLPRVSDEAPNPRLLAEAIVRLTSDEKALREVVEAFKSRDRAAFEKIIKQHRLEAFCPWFCHWVCVVEYRLICRIVCSPVPIERTNLAQELQSAGRALRVLLEKGKAFDEAVAASQTGDADNLRKMVRDANLIAFCYLICEWFCSFRCVPVCFTLCPEYKFEPIKNEVQEALAFGKALGSLAHRPTEMERLIDAVSAKDSKAWSAVTKELELQRFCFQLCRWICYTLCRRFCILVCPPIFLHPWFTHVGDFSITADIDLGTGLTNKLEAGHGGPNFGFFGCLSLRGFCPKFDPAHPTEQMAYRFLFQPVGAANATPVTGGFVCEVLVGTRYTFWNGNPFALQSVRIRGTGGTSPTPPPPSPAPAPPDHYIVPDAQGWVTVDANALDDGFDGWLMGFSTPVAFPGGVSAPGVSAGTAVPAANQKNGIDAAIIFQATRVSTIAAVNGGAVPDYSNRLSKIHINNWDEISLLDLHEFSGGLSCSPVTNNLHVLFTTDHELMAQWSIDMVTAATVVPAPVFPSGVGPRGTAGTDAHNTSGWPSCSYLLRLHTQRSLTTGLLDDPDKWEGSFLTFCIEH